MGWSFRKSLKLGPIRVNISKSGIGYSIGGKGLRVGRNAKGKAYSSLSIPGTGIRHTSVAKSRRAAHDYNDEYEDDLEAYEDSKPRGLLSWIFSAIKWSVFLFGLLVVSSVASIIWSSLRSKSTPAPVQPPANSTPPRASPQPRSLPIVKSDAGSAPISAVPAASLPAITPPAATHDVVDAPKSHEPEALSTKPLAPQSDLTDAGKNLVTKNLIGARDWHLNDGRIVHGTLKSFGGGVVRLTTPGEESIRLRVEELSAGDVKFIRSNLK